MTRKMKFKGSLEPQVFKGIKSYSGEGKFKVEYEPDHIEYTLTKEYIPDFRIEFKDGRVMYIEAKGFLRPEDRAKLLAVKAQHSDIDIRIIFERDNKMSRTSKVRYSDWATKHGFPFSIGTVPRSWFL